MSPIPAGVAGRRPANGTPLTQESAADAAPPPYPAAPVLASATAERHPSAQNRAGRMIARNWPLWLAAVGLIILLRSVLAPFAFAAVAAYVLGWPLRSLAARLRLPVPLLVALFYALVIGSVAVLGARFGPRLARETADLAANAPDIIQSLFVQATGQEEINLLGAPVTGADIADQLQLQVMDALGHPTDALAAAERFLSTFIDTLVFLVALFYLLVDGPHISEYVLTRFVAPDHRATVYRVETHLRTALGRYVRGQIFLVLLMAAVSYAGLSLLFGLRSALPIALATGFMELVPILGPTLATIVAASVGLFQGGVGTAAGIIAMYVVLRQFEDQLIMPVVIGRAVHLHPLATILSVLSGGALAGAPGMLIAVPVAAAGKILLDELAPPPTPAPDPEAEVPAVPGVGARR